MKFVALALALLLAVGSHAASMQADAPSTLAHIRSAVGLYMDQVKEGAIRALDHVDGTEYAQYKTQLSDSMTNLAETLKAAQAQAAPYTDSVVNQVMGATADVRASIMADVDALRADLQPKREALMVVVDRHIDEYRKMLEPMITDFSARHRAQMDELKLKMDPVLDQLSIKVANNVEETKTALIPIVESVRTKLTERLEGLKTMVSPYMEEYKEQMNAAFKEAKAAAGSLDIEGLKEQASPHVESLRVKAEPLVEEVKMKLMMLYEAIAASMNRN